jgi:[ribosomal protein S18]-alanine N-acetyltransferase
VSLPLFLDAATEGDIPALLALERRSFTHPWTEGNFREVVTDPSRTTALVLREARGPAAGEPALVAYCVGQSVADEVHILDLVVAEDRRRRGLGRWLLGYVLDRAARRGADRAFLEVRRSNEAAIALYRSVGFTVRAERRDYYREPGEDALVLEKSGLLTAFARDRKDP